MATRTQLEKLISDVKDCVVEFHKDFLNCKIPINDDSLMLHRFEEKLEFVLQYGLKEKLNILGSKKSFWDYICTSFSSSKRAHDGLKQVKSMTELKTSLGRGRAFIRFCLMHKCLADSLQTCFANQKITNDFYNEKSVPVQKLHSSALIESLYELNELNFDLTSRHADLDISWPTFARKLFDSSDLNPPSRNLSTSSFSSQNHLEIAPLFESGNAFSTELNINEDENNLKACFDFKIDADCCEKKNNESPIKCVQDAEVSCNLSDFQSPHDLKLQVKTLEFENRELVTRISVLEEQLKNKHDPFLQAEKGKSIKLPFPLDCNENINKNQASIEKYAECIKDFIVKQSRGFFTLEKKMEATIKENNNLYLKICKLREMLHSYGLLKAASKIPLANATLDLTTSSNLEHCDENKSCDIISLKPLLNTDTTYLIDIFGNMLSKFETLNISVNKLQNGLKSSQDLSDNLLSRVQDQELRLKGVTKELEGAQVLVSVMKKQQEKLKSAEEIFKYDLQEKRKLMTRLKKQLESTREDWNRVRQKNSESEAEWQDLRKEFVLRQKQASEESGFIDDKGCDSRTTSHLEEVEIDEQKNTTNTKPCVTIEVNEKPETTCKKTRLELLEEQCQLLYSNLVKNSSKSQELDNRLKAICKGLEPASEKTPNANILSTLPEVETYACTSPISIEENVREDLSGDSLPESSIWNGTRTSSEIGSLNSDCYSANVTGAEANLLDASSSDIPSIDLCFSVSCSEEKGEETVQFKNETVRTLSNESSPVPSFTHVSEHLLNYDDFQHDLVSNLITPKSSSVERLAGDDVNGSHNEPLNQVDSLLIRKKDLEKCLEHLEMHNDCIYLNDKASQGNTMFVEDVFALKSEKELLQKEVEDLRNKLLLMEMQFNQTSEQLGLSKAIKEQEVAALQFQLNTEALRYEGALKQFNDDDKDLKDMKVKITDQEQLICALEEALTEIKIEKEYEHEYRWQELEEIQFALMAREEECLVLNQELEKFREMKAHSEQDRASMEAELYRLRKDSTDLKSKIIKLLKEKDILWKRTDYLAHLQRLKLSDRWMADNEAMNCLGCKNNFSFILRRHHCRLCGRIFCHSCSNNWLLTTASRKKCRVCNECYKQHWKIKHEARRSSDVPCLDHDNEDIIISRLTHPISISSLNSEDPYNLASSLISFQVTDINHTKHRQLFSSAPDLRCVKQDLTLHPKSTIYNNLTEECDDSTNSAILSDEQKIKSRPSSIAYSPSGSLQFSDGNIVSSITILSEHTISEIKANDDGISGEFSVNAGIYRILILSENPPNELAWSFICDSQFVPVSLLYEEDFENHQQFVICNRDYKMDDNAQLSKPGVYALDIDFSSFRVVQTLKYNLKINLGSSVSTV